MNASPFLTRTEQHSDFAEAGQPLPDRERFLWTQQRYILENIKLADTKAGFVITLACAALSTLLTRGHGLTTHSGGAAVTELTRLLAAAGVGGMLAAVGYGAWSIKPRIGASHKPSPVSWTHIAEFPTLEGFQQASRALTVDAANDGLGEQVFHLSRICHRKHLLISRAVVLAAGGGFCLAADLLLIHMAAS